MVYRNKKCPHCEHMIDFMQAKGLDGYGSKIRQCPSCNRSYFDDDYVEIEIDGVRFADKCKIEPLKIIWAVILLLALIFGGKNLGQPWYIVCIIAFVLLLVLCAKDFVQSEKKKQLVEQERVASATRLSNIDYARFLAEKGKRVPRKYLYPAEK